MKATAIGILGAGKVGSAAAFALKLKGYENIGIYDIDQRRAEGEAMDLCDCTENVCKVRAWARLEKADIYVIAAGRADWSKNRAELLEANWSVAKPFFVKIAKLNPRAKVVVATNPSDELAARGRKYLKTVVASGYLLDHNRAEHIFGKGVRIAGTHGDRKVLGRPDEDRLLEYRNRAANIIALKGSTQWGVASEIARLVAKLERMK